MHTVSSCEKCWRDACRAAGPFGDVAAEYRRLLQERTGPATCTPEEQAGPDALWCYECHRRTFHQHTRICMVNPAHGAGPYSEEQLARARRLVADLPEGVVRGGAEERETLARLLASRMP